MATTNTLSPYAGWQDMSQYTAQGLAGASQAGTASYQAPTLSPYTKAGNVSVSNPGNITSSGVLADQRAYMNPYLNDVVNTSLANFDRNAGQQMAGYAAQGARNNAFGGSRFGIGETNLLGNLALGRITSEAGLRSDGWNTALSAAMGQANQNQNTRLQQAIAQANADAQIGTANANAANQNSMMQAQLSAQAAKDNALLAAQNQDRQLQALALLGGTANTYAGNDRADLALIANLGAQQQAIEQAQLSAPATQLGVVGNAIGAIPVGALSGQTIDATESGTQTQSGGSILGSILGGIASGVGSVMSDPALKQNVEKLGELDDGLGVYAYDYIWPGERQVGVMADEVAAIRPWALGPRVGGFQTVNYEAL